MTESRIWRGVGLFCDPQPNRVAARIIADTRNEADPMIDEDDGRVSEAMDPMFGRMNKIHIEVCSASTIQRPLPIRAHSAIASRRNWKGRLPI